MKIGSLNRKVWLALLACAFLQISAFASDTKDVVKNARSSYYSLKNHGLKSFKCEITPDWRKLLESINKKPISADDAKLKNFEGLRCAVAIDEQGKPTITPFMVDGSDIQPNLSTMVSGFQQMIEGFYETWTSMVFSNPFDGDNSDLSITQEGENYRLAGKSDGVDVEMFLDKNYTIFKMTTLSGTTRTVLSPVFEKTTKGLLLTSVSGDIADGAQKIFMGFQYQELQELQMPSAASFKITLPTQTILVDVAFSKYQIVKK